MSDKPVRPDARGKNRAALSNRNSRFDRHQHEKFDDGWQSLQAWEEESSRLRTELRIDHARSIISTNRSPDLPFDYSINPYKGCEQGCIYCYARPSHAFLGHSPGLDFERLIYYKPNAVELLTKTFQKPGYQPKPINFGANTDPYQPVERRLRITRGLLELLWKVRHPLTVVSKSGLVLRDLDLFRQMAEHRLVSVAISLTTLDRTLQRKMEPRAAPPLLRLRIIEELAKASVPVALFVAPVIPGLTDHEMEKLLQAGREAGAGSAHYVLLRLPGEVEDLFVEWLKTEYPHRTKRVLNALESARSGKRNNTQFVKRFKGDGLMADVINRRFMLACKRLGLKVNNREKSYGLRSDLFCPEVLSSRNIRGAQMKLI